MRRSLFVVGASAAALYAGASWWRRHPRVGARFVNDVVDPWLMQRGLIGRSRGELGVIEHVGRTTGTVRLTPVHPEPTDDGYRIIVPLGSQSQWARNVIAAGHCRMQVGGQVIELDEPTLLRPSKMKDLAAPLRSIYEWLGFRYLGLHRFGETTGTLNAAPATPTERAAGHEPTPEPLPGEPAEASI